MRAIQQHPTEKSGEDLIERFGPSLVIFDAAPIGMCIANLEGTLLMVNDSFCETIEYSRKEILGNSFARFTHPEDLPENLKKTTKVVTGEIGAYQMEKRYITKSGNVLNAIMKVTTLSSEKGGEKYLLAQILDITDRVQLFKKKEKSEKELREIFEEAAIGMVHTDQDLIIVNANKVACKLLGYQPDELIGTPIRKISHPEDIISSFQKSNELLKKESGNYTMEKRYLTKSGNVLHCILKESFVKGQDGSKSNLLGQITDISSLKEYEKLLKTKYKELTKVNSELDKFIYQASHDLKGPIATLKGLTNLYEISSPNKEILYGLQFSVRKLDNVIRELVEFSENANNVVVSEKVDIAKLFEESIEVLHFHPEYSKIKFITDIENVNPFVGDSRRLKPIINNLLINSIDYSDQKKSQSFVRISAKSENKTTQIVVEDNGIGMKKEISNRAFDMFYRGTELSTGPGLGLYLVKEIVTKLNGTVHLNSSPGQGTSVSLSLPICA